MKPTRRAIYASVTLLFLATFVGDARAQRFEVKRHTLKNGMKILVQEDHDPECRPIYLLPHRLAQRTARNHRAVPFLRAHDV